MAPLMLENEGAMTTAVDARAFAMLMSKNRTMRRLMAADRTVAGAVKRVAALRQIKMAAAEREHIRQVRSLEREIGGQIAPGWGRVFKIKVQPPASTKRAKSTRRPITKASRRRSLRAYKAPITDARGRVTIFFKVTYIGLKSKNWRPGLPADHVIYIYRDGALEEATRQDRTPISNMGKEVDEIVAAWRVIESVEQGYRANAKVQYRLVLNLPHELDAAGRRHLVATFCEREFGRLGLPYCAAVHEPDSAGDERNYHAHICFSTRPCERTGDYSWDISEEKVNGLTDPEGLQRLRALAAAHMNRAVSSNGLAVRYTHQSYAARGVDAVPQEHVGPSAMAAYDRGEEVDVIKRNAATVERNEAAAEGRRTERALELAERERDMLAQALDMMEWRVAATNEGRRAAELRKRTVIMLQRLKKVPRPIAIWSAAAAVRLRANGLATSLSTRAALRIRYATAAAGLQYQIAILRAKLTGHLATTKRAANLVGTTLVGHSATKIEAALRRSSELSVSNKARAAAAKASSLQISLAALRKPTNMSLPHVGLLMKLPTSLTRMQENRERVSKLHAFTTAWSQRTHEHRHAERHRQIEVVRALLMNSSRLPYRLDGRQVNFNKAAFTAAEWKALGLVDDKIRVQTLRERYLRDREDERQATERETKAAREAAERRANAEQTATALEAHRALVERACRIVATSAKRPYCLNGTEITIDWSNLESAERKTLDAVGPDDRHLREAMLARVRLDHAADMAERKRAEARQQRSASNTSPAVAAPIPAIASTVPSSAGGRNGPDGQPDPRGRTNPGRPPPAAAKTQAPSEETPAPAKPVAKQGWHPGMLGPDFGL